ncbi:HD-GYP domain-containing protein [Hydrogenophaga sp. OTU3427]|uniref:HD-GYP domain-containing protein n=1 Tax=Hydrogenophaga sp. OTU3427 TaxID=3043856 RepID=UPI00313D4E35
MTATPTNSWPAASDLTGAWTDMETRLSRLLRAPGEAEDFVHDLLQIEQHMVALLQTDADGSLYLMLQLAASSNVGYSASHALVCASLCHLVASEMVDDAGLVRSLDRAALTMNIAMTRVQDDLALQASQPTPAQKRQIDSHALDGVALLESMGVTDPVWLEIVARHHDAPDLQTEADGPMTLLTRILMATDRYTALISPRETRSGRCITDSGRNVVARRGNAPDPVGHTLLRIVGICPPGTFVRLQDQSVAVVLRRTEQPGTPLVAQVLDAQGNPIPDPPLLRTDAEPHQVEAALVTRSVRVRLNHVRLLQMAALA